MPAGPGLYRHLFHLGFVPLRKPLFFLRSTRAAFAHGAGAAFRPREMHSVGIMAEAMGLGMHRQCRMQGHAMCYTAADLLRKR